MSDVKKVKEIEKMKCTEILDEIDYWHLSDKEYEEYSDRLEELQKELDQRLGSNVLRLLDIDPTGNSWFDKFSEFVEYLKNEFQAIREEIEAVKDDLKRHRHDYSKTFTGRAEW